MTRQLLLLLTLLALVAACRGGADDTETAATADTTPGPLTVDVVLQALERLEHRSISQLLLRRELRRIGREDFIDE